MSQEGPVQVHSSKHFGPGQDFEFDRLRSRVPQKIRYLRSNLLTFYFIIINLRICLIRHECATLWWKLAMKILTRNRLENLNLFQIGSNRLKLAKDFLGIKLIEYGDCKKVFFLHLNLFRCTKFDFYIFMVTRNLALLLDFLRIWNYIFYLQTKSSLGLYTSDESPAMTHSVDDALFFMTHCVWWKCFRQ